MVIAIEACPMRCCTSLGGSSNPPIRPRDVPKICFTIGRVDARKCGPPPPQVVIHLHLIVPVKGGRAFDGAQADA
jgi:hypothetical protein